ncbi:ATP-dependent Clp protease proteolytic subunit [Streptomyces sp. P38-E01]|uniref:ATP-dependent Clp protease proteolytic subunit n=1 Tax=Streptomyces tardus TaxID=2780544 RepID=A0A949JTD0_9ACTN|nr:ATP-dependent Clp protease proteolytic subunit [Streptomyces tardus]MBU7600886.1 ATP-dependent Clp protease proteolytic subunit [Streptomyces tardus]
MHSAQARHVLPEFTERTADGTRTLDPYSKLLGERIILLGAPVDDACAGDVVAQLMYLEHAAPDRPISLYLNSPGGSFSAMTAVYDTLRYVHCEVETVCLGQAGSVAAVLLGAGTPGRRLALPGARVVLSQPALTEPIQGQPSDLAIQAQELLLARETLQTLLSRHTGRSREQIGRDVERDTVLDAAGALEFGLVDEISVPRAQQSGTGLGG